MTAQAIPDGPGYGMGVRYFGAGDPGAVGANEAWFDGTDLRIRNAANTAWVAIGAAPSTPTLAQVLAVGADANGVEITDLGAPGSPDSAARLADAGGGSAFVAATRTVSLDSFAPPALVTGSDPLIPAFFRDYHNNNVSGAALTALLAAMGLVWDGTAGTLTATKDIALSIDVDVDLEAGPMTGLTTLTVNKSYSSPSGALPLFDSGGALISPAADPALRWSGVVALDSGSFISFILGGTPLDAPLADYIIRLVQVA
jgi:hypothetical protein